MKSSFAKVTTATIFGAAIGFALINIEPVQAMNLKSYIVQWSGAQFDNEVTAIGTIVLDLDLVKNPGLTLSNPIGAGTAFNNIEIEVMGATNSNANGVFNASDFSAALLTFPEPVDLTVELVGQAGFDSIPGDLNVFRSDLSPFAPSGDDLKQLIVFGGEKIQLTSFAPTAVNDAVPTPAAILPSLLGLGGAAFRKRQSKTEFSDSV